MTFKHLFLGTAAASGMMLALAAFDPAGFSLATKAQAATNISVSINIGTFYDGLAPYGDWMWYHNRYIWLPAHENVHWRPYTEGHWAYTRRYGWLWISDERFGWATYHYGRWGYSRDIGWYWVPGRRWAPAWVAWSHGDDDIAWAPLPPDRYDDVNVVISFGDIPDYYWQAVPASGFLSLNISSEVIRDRDRVHHVLQNGAPQTVQIENNIVVNNVIKVDDIEKRTKKKVAVLEEKPVDNPDAAGKADSSSVAIFNPDVKDETNLKPKKIRKVDEVVNERKAKGLPQQELPADQTAAPVVTTDQPVPKLKKGKAVDTQQTDTGNATTEVPAGKPKKNKFNNKNAPQDVQQNVDQQNGDQQNFKKKKHAGPNDLQGTDKNANVPADQLTPPANGKQKKKGEPPANKDQKGQPVCDPAVEVCPPPAQ